MLGLGALGEFALGEGPVGSQRFVGGQFSQPSRSRKLAVAVIATSFVGFVAPPQVQAAKSFTQFSQPQKKRNPALAPWTNAPQPRVVQPYVFTKFSEPTKPRFSIFDDSQSVFDNPEPPALPPFTGFARFEQPLRAKSLVALVGFQPFAPFIAPPDTHDGVFVKRKRKRSGPDPIELELEEKRKRRAALELAVYGPEPEILPEVPAQTGLIHTPVLNVDDLARIVFAAQQAQSASIRAAEDAAEEDDIDLILREIF